MNRGGVHEIAIRGNGQYALAREGDTFEVPAGTPVVEVATARVPAAIRDILRADEQSILSALFGLLERP